MATFEDRMKLTGPLGKMLYDRLLIMVSAINELRKIIIVGQNPHKVNDTTDNVTAPDAADLDSLVVLEDTLDLKYAAHIASTSYHTGADSTNTLTAKTIIYKIRLLANDIKTKYNVHHTYTTSSVHAGSGDPNTVTVGDMTTTKAGAIALLNDIKTKYNLHRVNVTSCHGGSGDTTNVAALADLTSDSTWTQIQAMVDDLRTKYEAHRVLTAGSVHGAADSVNTIAQAAVGTLATVYNAHLTEMKGDLNAHIAEFGTYHQIKDTSNGVTKADSTTLPTGIALVNDMKATFNDHITRSDDDPGAVPLLSLEEPLLL